MELDLPKPLLILSRLEEGMKGIPKTIENSGVFVLLYTIKYVRLLEDLNLYLADSHPRSGTTEAFKPPRCGDRYL